MELDDLEGNETASKLTLNPQLDVNNIKEFMAQNPLFKDLDREFVDRLASEMQIRVLNDKDFILRRGEEGRALFFILRGEIEVISEDGETIYNVMKENSFFGEIAILFSIPRTASCRSKGKTLIMVLTKEKLEKVALQNPELSKAISHIAEERYQLYKKQLEAEINCGFGEEIELGITKEELKKVPLFRDCDPEFLHLLTLSLRPVRFQQNQDIIKKGDFVENMYFIQRGTAEMYEDRTVYVRLETGSNFGETSVLLGQKQATNVRCSSAEIDLLCLSKNALEDALKKYPEIGKTIRGEAENRSLLLQSRRRRVDNQAEMELEVLRDKIKKVPLFKDCEVGFLHSIVLNLTLKEYNPNDIIIKKDDIGSSMFFVISGVVEVISDDGNTVFAKMGGNTFFGEVALFFDIPRTATVRAKDSCVLFELEKTTVREILKKYPKIEKNIILIAENNYKLFKKRQEAVKKVTENDKSDSEAFEIEVTANKFKQIKLFESCDMDFLMRLALETVIESFKKGDTIFRKGEASECMYFIAKGQVEVVSEDGKQVYDIIKEGDFFGEVGMYFKINRTATIRVSSETLDTIVLTRKSLKRVLTEYPDNYKILVIQAEARYQRTQLRSSDKGKKGRLWRKSIALPPSKQLTEQVNKPSWRQKFRLRASSKSEKDVESAKNEAAENNAQEKGKMNRIKNKLEGFIKKRSSKKEASSDKNKTPQREAIKNIMELGTGNLLYMVTFLSVHEKVRLRETCHFFKKLSLEETYWLSSTFDTRWNFQSTNVITNLCKKYGHYVTNLNLEGNWQLEDSDMITISEHCRRLVSININNCWKVTDSGLVYIAQCCRELQEIHIAHCGKISGACFKVSQWPQLHTLDISHCKHFTDEVLELILSRSREIRNIIMRRCIRMTDFGMFVMSRYCRLLKALDLSDCQQVTDKCLKWIASSCLVLTSLNLTFCSHVTNTGIYDLSLGRQKFEKLSLGFCFHLTDAAIIFFPEETLVHLRYLSLRHCRQMSDSVLSYLGKTARNLSVLETTGCKGVTPIGRKFLESTLPRLLHLCYESTEVPKPKLIEVNRNELFKKQMMEASFVKA